MRIEVVGDRAISQQARTYAEYRFFATLTQLCEIDGVRRVRVRLREVRPGASGAGVACTVTVTLQGSDAIRIRTSGAHAYAAINDAGEFRRAVTQPGHHAALLGGRKDRALSIAVPRAGRPVPAPI